MRELTYREALREAMTEEMARDERVFLMGEEVGHYNGAYKVSEGMLERFGERRVVDTPIAETGFAGVGIGAAMVGLRPIIEFMTWNFSLCAFDQLVNNAAKLRYMSGGQMSIPMVFRGPGGAAHQLAAQHSQVVENLFAYVPGLKVVTPSTPYDAKGLLKTAIRDDSPVVIFEDKMMYRLKGPVPEGDYTIPFGKADIKRDLDYLLLLWDSFGQRLGLGRGPAALYEESDVAIRTIRDLFDAGTEAVLVDDPRVFERVRDFTSKLMPEKLDRIQLHEGPRPLFNQHGVEQDFEKIFARRVDLPSGGSIVFDQAEALVAIDVNSGKTRSDGFDFEQVALKTNLDAVPEIARQIRLRDLGGIIVCDFIDMQRMSNRRAVERALRTAMAGDRARSKLGRISQFGLLELTRQRLGRVGARRAEQPLVHLPESALLGGGFSSVDYAEFRDAASLERLERLGDRPARLLVAARIGGTRLIDNMPV